MRELSAGQLISLPRRRSISLGVQQLVCRDDPMETVMAILHAGQDGRDGIRNAALARGWNVLPAALPRKDGRTSVITAGGPSWPFFIGTSLCRHDCPLLLSAA